MNGTLKELDRNAILKKIQDTPHVEDWQQQQQAESVDGDLLLLYESCEKSTTGRSA